MLTKTSLAFQDPLSTLPSQIISICLPAIVTSSPSHHFSESQLPRKDVQVGDLVLGLVPKTNETLEDQQLLSQVGGWFRSFRDRKSFIFELLAVDHPVEVVECGVDGDAAVHPGLW